MTDGTMMNPETTPSRPHIANRVDQQQAQQEHHERTQPRMGFRERFTAWRKKHGRTAAAGILATATIGSTPVGGNITQGAVNLGVDATRTTIDLGATAVRENPVSVTLARTADEVADASHRSSGAIEELNPDNLAGVHDTTIRLNLGGELVLRSSTSLDPDAVIDQSRIVSWNDKPMPKGTPSALLKNFALVREGNDPDKINNQGPGLWAVAGRVKLDTGQDLPVYVSWSNKTLREGVIDLPPTPYKTEPAHFDNGVITTATLGPGQVGQISFEQPTP